MEMPETLLQSSVVFLGKFNVQFVFYRKKKYNLKCPETVEQIKLLT